MFILKSTVCYIFQRASFEVIQDEDVYSTPWFIVWNRPEYVAYYFEMCLLPNMLSYTTLRVS